MLKNFFINTNYIEAEGLDIGFDLYSMPHLIWLALMVLLVVWMCCRYKGKDDGERLMMRKTSAVILAAMEIIKDTVLIVTGWFNPGYLPFHLCGFSIFIMLADAFCPKQKLTGQMMMFAFMPGALSALLFANWTEYPFYAFIAVHSFIFHGIIVGYALMQFVGKDIHITYKGLWKTVLAVVLIAVPVYGINLLFAAYEPNFMFLMEASPGSPLVPLWNIFGPKWYNLSMVGMVIVIFHVLFSVYKVCERWCGRRT